MMYFTAFWQYTMYFIPFQSSNLTVNQSPLATENNYGRLKTHSKVSRLATYLKKKLNQ